MAETRARPDHLVGIQILRGIAACAVVLHHSLEMSNGVGGRFSADWFTTAGAAGVDIFFVISGFIMLHVSFPPGRAPLTPGRFLGRRVFRIYPLYWLGCAAMLALASAGFLRHQDHGAGTILRSLLLLPSRTFLIGVAWTLVYEVYFYLLFAASLVLRSVLASALLPCGAILLLMASSALLPPGPLRIFLANPIALEFCLGLGLNMLWRRYRAGWTPQPWLGGLGMAALLAAPLIVAHGSTNGLPGFARLLVWGLPAALIVGAALGPVRQGGDRAIRWATLIGDASYSIYLSHVFVMVAYGRVLKIAAIGAAPQAGFVAIVVPICIAVGLACHIAVEKPLLALLNRRIRRRAPVAFEPMPL